jgi:DNA-directed RNA polymerase II subunit RPB1
MKSVSTEKSQLSNTSGALIPSQISFVQFGTLTAEEWLSFSVCEIKKPSPQGGSDKIKEETPYDPRMGCLENGYPCHTCGGDNKSCPGHFGHVLLPVPIYNNMFLVYILKILQCVCDSCARSRLLPDQISISGLSHLKGLKRLRAFTKRCEKIAECPWDDCNAILPFYDFNKIEIRRYYDEKSRGVVFKAGEALNIFLRISNETYDLLGFNQNLSDNPVFTDPEHIDEGKSHLHQSRPESFIFTVLPVIPPFARPFVIRDGQRCDDDLTDKYNAILKACIKLRDDDEAGISATPVSRGRSRKGGGKLSDKERQKTEMDLQAHIWALINNKDEKSKLSSGGRAHKSIAQRIGGKDGRLQGNIAGKRSDFTARSVIAGGGIMLKMDELGVPAPIARELTRPFTAKEWNIQHLQRFVHEGKVNRVIRNGIVRRLDMFPDGGRQFTLMIDDKVEKQLENGDVFPFNRQPSLRAEGSFLAFRVKIVDGYAFRIPMFCTSGYNADCDGRFSLLSL